MKEHNSELDNVDLQYDLSYHKVEITLNYTKARKLRINRKLENRDW